MLEGERAEGKDAGFRWNFFRWIYSRRKRAYARGVGQQMKHVDIKATRFPVSETDRFTLAVNHITPWNIFSRLELNHGRAVDASPRPSIHRRSRSLSVVETFANPPMLNFSLYPRWKSGYAPCSGVWNVMNRGESNRSNFSLLFFVTSIQSWNTCTPSSVYSPPPTLPYPFVRNVSSNLNEDLHASDLRVKTQIYLLVSEYIFIFSRNIQHAWKKVYCVSRVSSIQSTGQYIRGSFSSILNSRRKGVRTPGELGWRSIDA